MVCPGTTAVIHSFDLTLTFNKYTFPTVHRRAALSLLLIIMLSSVVCTLTKHCLLST